MKRSWVYKGLSDDKWDEEPLPSVPLLIKCDDAASHDFGFRRSGTRFAWFYGAMTIHRFDLLLLLLPVWHKRDTEMKSSRACKYCASLNDIIGEANYKCRHEMILAPTWRASFIMRLLSAEWRAVNNVFPCQKRHFLPSHWWYMMKCRSRTFNSESRSPRREVLRWNKTYSQSLMMLHSMRSYRSRHCW